MDRGPAAAGSGGLSRREFLLLSGAAAATAFLSACTRGAPAPGDPGEKVQIVYQDWRTEWFLPMVQRMLEQFHEEHPNIRVFYTPDPEDLQARMLSELRSGTAADVFQGCGVHS
jgi:ABC-type glycerol-3-phosphate transport system substrate-binding protein